MKRSYEWEWRLNVHSSHNDIVCLKETQHAVRKPVDFEEPAIKKLILVRKRIKLRELDVTRWASDNLRLIAVEVLEQPVRNIVNVYACCKTMEEQDWMIFDDLQSTLPGEPLLCGDLNARGEI